ncbi:beta-glucosidase [Actinoplanes campanulatus]|uniref:Beta-glucosidase n=1 Tax=Actinoplanes campanulatus TaxID=113559 RepID=A0A7W5FI21_9ACTN|nr:GH1 family beta-glucosidase [Actinoplanes campanulatus]MBB3099263.1 beta-glucosidase [Actinoplanes campanulatus]GGN40742.1 beta-glucosidase [Actinoplanes campanulatus]GID40581.1 beta-glucosidase [Actinoplanes campanulatus]
MYPQFPPGFRFGMSTSAYQIEGAADAGGKGPSIWDTFTARPGAVRHGQDARVASDHYHRYASDVDLIAEAGVHDYRFSFSWPRVLAGDLDFYDRLVDRLLASGVRPMPTLYHWDLPQELEDAGGWMNRDTAHRLADHASALVLCLGDRVRDWITMNEMNVHTLYGYALADHAPARGLGLGALPAAHHQLLAHGLAVQVLRTHGAGSIGVAQQHFPVTAASDDPADVEAAAIFSALTNWTFSDPILLGDYPDELIRAGVGVPEAQLDRDLELIRARLDFYGVNYYEPTMIEAPKAGKDYSGVLEVDIPADMPFSPVPVKSDERTDFGWAVVPAGLTDILVTLRDRYPDLPPVIITENGASFHDSPPGPDGRVHDERRISYLDAHLRAVSDAITAGVRVDGYYVWSAIDNFEWAAGYDERFGLIYVDFSTLERTKKDSWFWYRDLIAAQPRN